MTALHPLTKLTIALCAIALAWGMVGAGWATGILILGVLPWSAGLGVLWPTMWRTGVAIAPLAALLFPLYGWLHPGSTPRLTLGSFTLTQEGLAYAYGIVARLAVLAAAVSAFALSTPPAALAAALTQRGLSPAFTYLLVSPLHLLPAIRTKASTILAAQQARGLDTSGNLWQRSRALVPLVLPLVLGALVDVQERALALEARAFRVHGPKTSLLQLPDSVAQRWGRYGMVGLTAALIGWSRWQCFSLNR